MGVTYATSTMGADHTAGYAVATNILGVGGKLDPLKPEGQIELVEKPFKSRRQLLIPRHVPLYRFCSDGSAGNISGAP